MKSFNSIPCVKMVFMGLLSAMLPTAHATIPEPDNLLYGSITLDNVPVTAARTDVVIEARRTTNGPAIASYRMGNNPALGDFYSLLIPVESLLPASNTNSSQVGDNLFITLLDGSGLRAQTSFVILERGVVQRVDFGAEVIDGDGDGLPDAWELLHYSNLTQTPDSLAANGQTAWQHYLAGTDPTDPDGGFKIHIALSNGLARVSFVAQRAEGPGYEGTTRLYSLETNPGLDAPSWNGVPGFIDVLGDNQTVAYNSSGLGNPAFYRGKISLTGINVPGNDVDGDGLPDAWENSYFGNLNQTANSINLNGQTALQNFVAGTDPNDPSSMFKLTATHGGGTQSVSFFAMSAQGLGYEGRQRFYALESSTNPSGQWIGVPAVSNVLANDQTVTYPVSSSATPAFYRGRVWLQP